MKLTRRQLRKLITESVKPGDEEDSDWGGYDEFDVEAAEQAADFDEKFQIAREKKAGQGYEDNQTKMVRRYLIQLGIGESFFDMNEEQIDSMAADLRLMSPSQKKLRDLYDLSVPTDIWQRNRNLGQTPDGSNLQRINQMMANRPDDDDEPEWADSSVQGGYSQQQYLDDQQMSQPGGWYGDDED